MALNMSVKELIRQVIISFQSSLFNVFFGYRLKKKANSKIQMFNKACRDNRICLPRLSGFPQNDD